MDKRFLEYIEREFYGFAVMAYFQDHPEETLDDLLHADLGMTEKEMQTGIDFLVQHHGEEFFNGIF